MSCQREQPGRDKNHSLTDSLMVPHVDNLSVGLKEALADVKLPTAEGNHLNKGEVKNVVVVVVPRMRRHVSNMSTIVWDTARLCRCTEKGGINIPGDPGSSRLWPPLLLLSADGEKICMGWGAASMSSFVLSCFTRLRKSPRGSGPAGQTPQHRRRRYEVSTDLLVQQNYALLRRQSGAGPD